MTGTYVNSEKHGIEGLTALRDSYNGKHERGTNTPHQGRPDTNGLAYLTPAKVRSPTGRDSIFHNSIPYRGHTTRPTCYPKPGYDI